MDKKQLIETLDQLHEELTDQPQVDPETMAHLRTVMSDIDRMLQSQEKVAEEEAQSVTDRLQELLNRFEAEHPKLTGVIGRITDGLANLGI